MEVKTRQYRCYNEWVALAPQELANDALWTMPVYRKALFTSELAWHDIVTMRGKFATRNLIDQWFRAVCSVSANIAEGYSRSSGKDRRRFYEYAHGSAREARDWYYKAQHTLGEPVTLHRTREHTEVIRQLLTLIPKQTTYVIRETQAEYVVSDVTIQDIASDYANIPFAVVGSHFADDE